MQTLEKMLNNPPPFGINSADHNSNLLLIQRAKTRFKVGQHVRDNSGEIVQITEVQPRGFITRSESKSYFSFEMLPPVYCDCDIYRYKPLGHNTLTPSNQTTEENLTEV